MIKSFILAFNFLLCACSATKPLYIQTYPSKAEVFLNQRFVGTTPLVTHIPKHERADIYVSKSGYLPITKELIPQVDAEGAILWGGNKEKGHNIQEKELNLRLQPLR